MKKFKVIYCLLVLLTTLTTAQALEHNLVSITNDETKDIFVFVVKSDNKNQEIRNFYKDSYDARGVRTAREQLSLRSFLVESGLVLEERQGRVVLSLKSENFETHNGGHIILDTLYNGATGERREYEFELARTDISWELVRDGQPVKRLHLKSNKVFLLGTVGVANIISATR